ncbi:DnaB-like helicase C-terminal domain-containing protein, partial [Borreliella burgdorferi 297]
VNTIELTYKNKNLEHVGDIAKKISYDIKNGELNSNWIESGFKGLDRIIQGGRNESFVIIIGVRPSIGKTAFALNIVNNICARQNRVGFFTLEMSSEAITMRLISIDSCIEVGKLLNSGLMNKNEVIKCDKSISKIINYPLYIESTRGIQIYELSAQARLMQRIYDIQIIFIDYIGLIVSNQKNIPRFEQVACLIRS